MSFAHNLLLAASPGIHVGGSEQMVSFLEEALRLDVDRLRVLAPYVDAGVFANNAFRHAWERLLQRSQTIVSVRTAAAARAVLDADSRRTIDLRLDPTLHAKAFVAWRPGAEIALIGSHNLTAAALHANKEVGILIKPGADERLRSLVQGLRRAVEDLVRGTASYSGSSSDRPAAVGCESVERRTIRRNDAKLNCKRQQ